MTFAEFHNALRILLNIDRDELEAAKILPVGDHNAWGAFKRDPFRWFIRSSDDQAHRLWEIIERRQAGGR